MKTSETFTLSIYDRGTHQISGKVTKENIKYRMFSFKESLSPMCDMINEFHRYPLGTKIKVTMEAVK